MNTISHLKTGKYKTSHQIIFEPFTAPNMAKLRNRVLSENLKIV